MAEILAAGDPDVWRRPSAEHVADHSGHCRACRSSSEGVDVRLVAIFSLAGSR